MRIQRQVNGIAPRKKENKTKVRILRWMPREILSYEFGCYIFFLLFCLSVCINPQFIYSFVYEFRQKRKPNSKKKREDNHVNFINHLPKEPMPNEFSFLPFVDAKARKSYCSVRNVYVSLCLCVVIQNAKNCCLFYRFSFRSMLLLSRE